MTDDDLIRQVLTTTTRIAMLGASNNPDRPSYGVLRFLLTQGFHVTPVNPTLAGQTIHGQKVVATLAEAAPLDMVDLFRNPSEIEAPIREAIRLNAKTIWTQLGVINPAATAQATTAGLTLITNRCPAIEIPRLGLTK